MSAGAVEDAIARFFVDGAGRVGSADHDALWSALREAAEGGKRIRPMLLTTVYEALGGTDERVAGEVAAALELLHTAFVVHDDVIDGDTVRRGRPNVSGTFAGQARSFGLAAERAARYGDAAGILAGDLALAGAVRTLALCGAGHETVRRMLDLVDRALHVTAAGELTDVRLGMLGGRDLTETLTMEEHKTAVYSFELPLQLAAVLAGSDDACTEALGRFGLLLGVAFQLRDDLDGMFGDRARTGKSALSDLREGKCTPLMTYARDTDAWPEIAPHLGAETVDEGTAARVRDLLLACGARRFVEDLARGYAQAASEVVAHLTVAPLLQEWVTAVTDEVRSAA
ncbi:polyprenyl synthetase family protein [Georgenia subflava]|nr:polyprenyl synthetase family protein [Georgenia subflava]